MFRCTSIQTNVDSLLQKIEVKDLFSLRWCLLILLFFSFSLTAQDTTYNNYTGNWSDNATWITGTSPGISNLNDDAHIYGFVSRFGDLGFVNGDLFVHDTLVIYGDLILGNNADLSVDSGAILIVRGDYSSGNQAIVSNGGIMVVTGEWTMSGANNQGSFENDGGQLYVFDPVPGFKSGDDYLDLNCDTCVLGYDDLIASEFGDFFLRGSYEITLSGPAGFCPGDSVILSTTDTGVDYQWYLDDAEVPGETSDSLVVFASGDYHVTFKVDADSFALEKVTVTAFPLPVVTIVDLAAGYCIGYPQDTILGLPAGGLFNASPDYSLLGGDSALFTPLAEGTFEFVYVYTDGNGCTDSASSTTIVHPLPVAFIDGAAPSYCEGSLTDTLVGSPSGGVFTAGPGITAAGPDSVFFDPALPGNYDIYYTYTDINGCADTALVSTVVYPLPVISIIGADASYCIGESADTIIATPAGGTFVFTTGFSSIASDSVLFDPSVAGSYDLRYIFSDVNGCTDSAEITIVVHPLPVLFINGTDTSYCLGESADTITATPSGGTFVFDSGFTSVTTDSVVFDPSGEGSYSLRYIFSDLNGCTDSTDITLVVHPLPSLSFTGVLSDYCANSTYDTLIGSQAPEGLFFGDEINDLGNGTAEFTVGLPGIKNIYYTHTDANGCTDTALVSTVVHPLPVISISGADASYCIGESADTITATPAGGTFVFTSGFSSIAADSVLFDPSVAGSYDLRYIFSDVNGCTDTADISIVVYPLPALSVTGILSDYCADSPFDTLTGNLAPEGLFFGDEINDLGNGTAEFAIGAPGIKTIFYTAADMNGCIDTVMVQTEVHALPVVIFIGLDSLFDISDASVTLIGSPFGGVYTGNGITGDVFDPAAAGVGIHEIIYTYTDGYGCESSDTAYTEVRDYDFRVGARIIPSIDNWCSLDAQYTTIAATADEPKPGCWNDGPAYNRWFMFQATTGEVHVELKIGGDEGSMRRPRLALWDTLGNLVGCQEYLSDYEDITMGAVNLVPGEWYFISVDNDNNSGYRGTFTLCVDDEVDYDFKEGAIELPHFPVWCSEEAIYTTRSASADRDAGSCWVNGPTYNRWFKFRATDGEVAIDVKTGGTEGTIRRIQVALWDSTGNNELACKRYSSDYDDVRIQYVGLTPGEWYHISVDNHENGGYRGTFTVCLDTEVDYDFMEGAIEIADPHDWCSADAEFSTMDATPDRLKGSTWNTGPNFNRWFKFRATTNELKADLKTGGDMGTMRYSYIALWDSAGNEVSSARYFNEYGDIFTSSVSLVPGDLYYISVDNYNNTGYRGTFTLCVADSIGYDFKEGAIELPSVDNWCSEDAAYTTMGATPDRLKGTAWNSGPNFNRWFKFTATTEQFTASMLTGGDFGTLRYGYIAIWDELDNEIGSARYYNPYDEVKVSTVGLTVGETYYISVDNYNNTGYRGSFTLCVDDSVDYDYRESAEELTDLDYWCSALQAYTTMDATPDWDKGTAWNSGPNHNRWFRFRATKEFVKVDLLTGGDEGSLRYGFLALWDSVGNEISSARYNAEYSDITVSAVTLVPGDWYFISVDNHNSTSYRGSFSLCITDTIDYDFKEAAVELPSVDNWCSADAAFTTMGATPDRLAGSAWNTGPSFNRWFKFTATSNQFTARLLTGGDYGTLRYGYIAIWDELDNEIVSARYNSEYDAVKVGTVGLTVGETYYISVDNHSNTGHRGSFTLCVDDSIDYDYREAAKELTDLNYWCSPLKAYTTMDATPDWDKGSAWYTGPNHNRWFMFRATREFVKVDLLTGGDEGSLRYGYLALWDSLGNEISSARYISEYSDMTVSAVSLVPGDWYFVSVDNHNNAGYRGTFSLCITDTIDYDFKEASLEIPHATDWCSADASYTTIGATPDRLKGSTWYTGPNNNRWFKFLATATTVKAELKTGGLEGSLRYGYIAIFNEDDVELTSARYTYEYSDLTVGTDSLTVGNWYYIAVDNHNNLGYRGTFTLCVTDTVDYDFKSAAIEVDIDGGYCSDLKAFTTIDATPDESRGTTWISGPNNNRWFKFTAPGTSANVVVKTGGEEGTLRYPFVAIWTEDGTEVASNRYIDEYSDINAASDTLTPGNTYYISVDNHSNTGYVGTFSLCVYDTIDYDFKSGAFEIVNYDDWCSDLQEFSTIGASADGSRASCWNSGPNYNRWFKFRATSADFMAVMRTGGSYGTLRSPLLALYDSIGNEKACSRYINDYQDIEISTDTFDLVIGDWYYLMVDNYEHFYRRGTFTLCTDDKLSYDFKDGAETITDLDNWCSDLEQFSTVTATPDESAGSCWPNGPNYNRWFRFQATTASVSAQIRTFGAEGDVDRLMVALWDEMLNEVDCNIYQVNESDVEVFSTSLTVGDWYYISVDNFSGTGYRGTFTVCLLEQLENDFKAGAIELSDFNQWCSAEARYTNSIATADESQGSCWSGIENKNVWFRFTPNTANVTVELKTGGALGSITSPQMAIWDAAGTELLCVTYSGSDTLTMNAVSLNPGEEYFISVDDDGTSGTFTLCIDDDVVYDYPVGAYELTDISDWCSPDAGFANSTVSADARSGSCWTGSPFNNSWFKFQATGAEIKISVTTGGAYGSMQRQQVGLWNIAGDEVGCAVWIGNTGTVVLQSDSLTAGNWYWIGVDDDRVSGSFTLCVTDETDFDYRHSAYEIADITQWCSGDGEFSNRDATDDETPGSCWSGAVNKNVWFRFTAQTPFAKITLRTGSVYGDMQRQQTALFNESGEEVGCAIWTGNQGAVVLQTDTLTVGHTYWISVDDDRVSGSFTICTDDSPDYDYKQGAFELTDLSNWCSANEQFSNFWATDDEAMGSCWNGTVNKNVWFKFTATTRFINIKLRTGNVYGDIRRPQMALWRDDGTEVACIGPVIDMGTLELVADTLTSGYTYFLSVDDNYVSNDFTLCIDDQPTFDYKEGAIELLHDAGCSMEAGYTNYYATDDQLMGSCWSGAENKNVWFKFRATSNYLTLSLKTGTVYGDMRRGQMAVWREDGTEVKCVGRLVDQGTTVLSADTLTVDDWYYISVDDDYRSGSFTICIENTLNYDYKFGAFELTDISNWCSSNEQFTNFLATDDELMGSCWSGTENKNVWFKFTATNRFINIKLRTGNIYGDIVRPQMALWREDGTEVACVGPIIYQGTLELNADTLTAGHVYYLSVDDNQSSNDFTLCINDQPSFDYKEGAIELPHDAGCSVEAGYTNFFATADQSMGSCWSGSVNKNVWFKFQATSEFLTLRIKTGTVYGSMNRAQMAVWREDGTEVKCLGRNVYEGTSVLSVDTLTVGDWYYISVDDDQNSGSFTICIENILNNDFWDGATVLEHDAGCSTNASYTNFYATEDESMASCWSGTENKNVWFSFQATSPYVTVTLKNGNIYGSQIRGQMALWNSNKEELKCVGPVVYQGTTRMSLDTLTVGNWYWISVDDNDRAGSFTLCIDDEVSNDYQLGAIEVPHAEWCSTDAAFRNTDATPDQSMGSCWSGTVNKNVWFKFLAIGPHTTVTMKTGNVYGTLRRGQMAIWNEDGDEVKCVGRLVDQGTTTLSIDSLTAGNWYYISVDDDYISGSFSLCMSDKVNYDYKAGAVEVQHTHGCYPERAFSNYQATPDGSQGSCWSGTVNKNVWFRFQAESEELKVNIQTGSVYGSMQRQQVALWDASDNEVACARWVNNTGSMIMQTDALTVGEWYYISVDDDRTSGTFSLCVSDSVDYDYHAGALELNDINDYCSGDAEFSNVFATDDRQQGGCWSGTVNKNVWFKLDAITTNLLVEVKTGNVYGTMRRQQFSVWNESGDEVGCARWSTNTGTLSLRLDTLTAGNTYYISVDDDLTSGTFSLCVQGNPLAAVISGTDVTCNGENDGTVTVVAQGGTQTSFSYAWTFDGVPQTETGTSLTGLGPGVYEVTVTDDGDPSTTITRSFTVNEDPPLLLSLLKTDESCSGVSDGTITANALGGTSTAYFYNWYRNGVPTGDVTPTITGKNAGWYRVVVTDAGATTCTITDSIEVTVIGIASTAPTGIDISNNNTCQGTSKTLTVTGGSLGTGAVWRWYMDAAYTVSAGPDGISLTADPAATTTYYVRAEGDCNITSGVSAAVIVEMLTPPVISGDTEVCTPVEVTYSVSPEAGMSYQWSVTEGAIVGSDAGTEVTVSWTGTVAGTVEVTATSGSGCSVSNSENITKHAIPVVGDIVSDSQLTRR